MSRLDSGWPGTIAGPEFPPFSKWSRESSCSPPSLELVWQAKQFLGNTGRARDLENSPGSCAGSRRGRMNKATETLTCPGMILIGFYHISYLITGVASPRGENVAPPPVHQNSVAGKGFIGVWRHRPAKSEGRCYARFVEVAWDPRKA